MHPHWTVIVSAEHASNAVPDTIDLGVKEDVLKSHVAWDPGAKEVAEILSENLSAPLFLGRWTRLVADLNRSPHNPESVPEIAFGEEIPANLNLTFEQRQARLAQYHAPYWDRVRRGVQDRLDTRPDACVLHLSIHSFTGEFNGEIRPMSMGVMLDPVKPLERHAADVMLEHLNHHEVHAVENEPYDGRMDALVTGFRPLFYERYAGIEIELSQNHLEEIDALGHRLLAAVQELKIVG